MMARAFRSILGLAALGVILTALAAWGGAIWNYLDAINHFAPFWLLLSLSVGLGCIWAGAGRWGSYCLVAAMAHAAIMAPEFVRPASLQARPNEPTIRIVWLNTWMGSQPSDETLRYLETSGADFLLLSELHDVRQEGFRRLRAVYPIMVRCRDRHGCDTVILAKREALSEQTDLGLRAVAADFDIEGARLRLIAAHLARPNPPDRQHRQLASLLQVIGGDRDNVLLAGDFNSTPWSFTLRRFDRASGLDRHTRALPTWPAQAWTQFQLPAVTPFLPIDHVYSGSRWRLVSLRRGPRTSSDHYPIEATFAAISGAELTSDPDRKRRPTP